MARFPSVDPIAEDFKYLTPYQYAGNTPIWATDLDGLEPNPTTEGIIPANIDFDASDPANLMEKAPSSGSETSILSNPLKILGPLGFFMSLGMGSNSMGATRPLEDMLLDGEEFIDRREESRSKKDKKFYVTYTKVDDSGTVYSGRTSGTYKGDAPTRLEALKVISARDLRHKELKDAGFGAAELDQFSTSYGAIRGREQQLIDANGKSISDGGKSANKIRGVSY